MKFRYLIFQIILVIDGWVICCELALRWIPLDLTDDESTLVQVMAWCRQATSHYLSQCWPRSLSPYGVTRPQWVNALADQLLAVVTKTQRLWVRLPHLATQTCPWDRGLYGIPSQPVHIWYGKCMYVCMNARIFIFVWRKHENMRHEGDEHVQGLGVTKPISSVPLFSEFFSIVKTYVRY